MSRSSLRLRGLVSGSVLPRPLMLVGLLLLLAGCGASTAPVAVVTPTLTPITYSPTATPHTVGSGPVGQKCATLMPPDGQGVTTVGDMQYSAVNLTGAIDPLHQLPDSLSSQPYQVNGGTSGYLDKFPVVNQTLYSFSLCNASTTKAHVLNSIVVKLDAFQADSNTINTSHYCIRLYTRQGMVDHTGCGGGYAGGDLNLVASFANGGAVGSVVSTSPDATMGSPAFPVTLGPGYGVYTLVTITPTSTPGTSSYRFGFALDGAPPIYPIPATTQVLNAKTIRQWDGDACNASGMQSQIPAAATTPPTYYICPQQ